MNQLQMKIIKPKIVDKGQSVQNFGLKAGNAPIPVSPQSAAYQDISRNRQDTYTRVSWSSYPPKNWSGFSIVRLCGISSIPYYLAQQK